MSSKPPNVVRPCGVPSSTRSAPASQSSRTRAATSSGVPAMQKRSSGRSPSSSVGSCGATTSRYGPTTERACSRAQAPSSSTTVTQPVTSFHARVVDPAADEREEIRVRGPSHLDLVRDRARPARGLPSPGSDRERHRRPNGLVLEPRPGREREALPLEAALVPGQERADHGDRLAQRRERALLAEAELVEPGALRKTEVRAPARDGVEHRDLAGDLVRVERERVERGRAEPDPLGHARHEQQRPDRGLVEQVVEDGEDVDARRLRAHRDRLVRGRLLIASGARSRAPFATSAPRSQASARRSARCA